MRARPPAAHDAVAPDADEDAAAADDDEPLQRRRAAANELRDGDRRPLPPGVDLAAGLLKHPKQLGGRRRRRPGLLAPVNFEAGNHAVADHRPHEVAAAAALEEADLDLVAPLAQ